MKITHPKSVRAALGALLLLVSAAPADASTRLAAMASERPDGPLPIQVDTLADGAPNADGNCSLREAILNKIAGDQSGSVDCGPGGPGIDIRFSALSGTIQLTSALPTLATAMNLIGTGADRLTIRRNTGGDYRIFDIPAGVIVGIAGLRLENGKAGDGGAIRVAGGLMMDSCELVGNEATASGGAIFGTGDLEILDSTIRLNAASSGGAIAYSGMGELTFENLTMHGNLATSFAGGLVALSSGGVPLLEIRSSTLTNNTGPGAGAIALVSSGSTVALTIRNTILDGNSVPSFASSGTVSVGSLGHNLASDAGGGFLTDVTDQTGVPAKLGALGLWGGTTWTREVLPGSAAFDAGDCGSGAGLVDQRGVSRPQGSACDIGAFERAAVSVAGYWPLRDGGGSVARDRSGVGVDGVITGASWVNDAEVGRVLDFPGNGGFVHVPAFVTQFATAQFTISAWVKIEAGFAGALFYKGDGDRSWEPAEKQFWFGDGNNGAGDGERPSFVGWGNDYAISSWNVPITGWHHLAMTWRPATGPGATEGVDGGTPSEWHYLIDGVEPGYDLINYVPNHTDGATMEFYIGWDGSSEAQHDFRGRVADVAVYSDALAPALLRRIASGDLSEGSNLLFYDGLESGDAGNWSDSVP